MKGYKLKKIIVLVLTSIFLLTSYAIYANEQVSLLNLCKGERNDLKKVTVRPNTISIVQDTTEEEFKNQIEVKAWYKDRSSKLITDYTTDYNKISGQIGKHQVEIKYTEGNITRCDWITVCITKKEETSILKAVKQIAYLKGYEDGTFRPNGSITREEMATMLARLFLNGEEPVFKNIYLDTKDERYSTPYISYISERGIMKGDENQMFRPQDKVTRQEAKEIFEKVAKERQKTIELNGLQQEGDLTRAEAVTILNKIFERVCTDIEIRNPYSDLQEDFWAYQDIICASIEHTYYIEEK